MTTNTFRRLSTLATISLALAAPSAEAARFKRVFVVVLENTSAARALKQDTLSALAKEGALLKEYRAITHPSYPNYLAMISGSTHGITTDTQRTLKGRHLGNLLEESHKTWKTYAEGYPASGECYLKGSKGLYARKHVPFLSFKDVQDDPAKCANVVPGKRIWDDVATGTLADVMFYIPNLDDDGHDTGVGYADAFMKAMFLMPPKSDPQRLPLLKDPRFTKDLLFVITFDEDNGTDRNNVYTAFWGESVTPGAVIETKYNHYDLLRTIEDELGLGTLGAQDASAMAIQGVWR